MVTSMREPPMISVEVMSSALARTIQEIQANDNTNPQRPIRRDKRAWTAARGIEGEHGRRTNCNLFQVSCEREAGTTEVPLRKPSRASTANLPGPKIRMIREAIRKV